MQTVVAEISSAERAASHKPIRRIYYKRRTVSASGEAFESSWTKVPDDEIVSFGTVRWALDRPFLNDVKAANAQVVVRNINHKWRKDSPESVFAGGFEPFRTKFQIRAGARIKRQGQWTWGSGQWGSSVRQWGGTGDPTGEEEVVIFTGYLADNPEDEAAGTARLQIESPDVLLREADAENVSNPFTETFSGDNATLVFTTSAVGVGKISSVSVNGIIQIAGTDYSVSQLNEASLGAKVSFVVAPPSGSGNISISGSKWKQNRAFEDLVKDLLTEAGINNHSGVQVTTFPNGVNNRHQRTTQSDWQAGTNSSHLDSSNSPGDLRPNSDYPTVIDDFSDGDFSLNPAWTIGAGGPYSIVSLDGRNHLAFFDGGRSPGVGPTSGRISTPFPTPSNGALGVWEGRMNLRWEKPDGFTALTGIIRSSFYFALSGSDPAFASGYMARFEFDPAALGAQRFGFSVYQVNGGVETRISKVFNLGGPSVGDPFFKDVHFRISHRSDGTFEVMVWRGTVLEPPSAAFDTDSFVNTLFMGSFSPLFMVHSGFLDNTTADTLSVRATLTSVRYSSVEAPAGFPVGRMWPGQSHVTPAIDLGSFVISLGKFDRLDTKPSGTSVLYESRTAATAVGLIGAIFQPVLGNGLIPSGVNRFIQARITFTPSSDLLSRPTVHAIGLNYKTTTTLVSLANFTGMTAQQAVQEIARLTDYEWGFSPSEVFFYRPRDVSLPADIVLARKDIESMPLARLAYERIFNLIRAEFGANRVEISPETEGEAVPNSFTRYGKRPLDISGSQLLFAVDSNLALGTAKEKYETFKEPRQNRTARVKLLGEAELSDVVSIELHEKSAQQSWTWGSETWGSSGLRWGGLKASQSAAFDGKIVGLQWNLDDSKMEIELEAI